jgi:hypothetical protein
MGVGADLRPVHECTSDPQIVQQVIFTRIQPLPTRVRGYSLISKSMRAAIITAAFAVLSIIYSSVSLQFIQKSSSSNNSPFSLFLSWEAFLNAITSSQVF